jgi:hypothetical protein
MMRSVRLASVLMALVWCAACQSPTSASTTYNVDDFVTASSTTATASPSTGRTYRVVRGNNQPDEVLTFQYVTTFSFAINITSKAKEDSVDLTFPVTVTSVSGKVEQASGGIVTPPTTGDVEHFESVLISSSGSTISDVGGGITMVFQVWYSLPSGNREARITQNIAMKDSTSSAKTFTKTVYVNVSP